MGCGVWVLGGLLGGGKKGEEGDGVGGMGEGGYRRMQGVGKREEA